MAISVSNSICMQYYRLVGVVVCINTVWHMDANTLSLTALVIGWERRHQAAFALIRLYPEEVGHDITSWQKSRG